ncbi:hypothetical protein HDU83_000733 [Entophlyctis luteolus]|nr:hypothetical protein HDU83_000733 [Entophlyctis luteolus]
MRALQTIALWAFLSNAALSQASLSDLIVYNGALGSDWQNWSWDTDFTFDYTGVPLPAGDGSFLATSINYGGISFYSPTPFNDYSSLAFLASGDPSLSYSVAFGIGATYTSPFTPLSDGCVSTLSAAAFVPCYFDFTGLNATNYAFDRFVIQSMSAENQTITIADLLVTSQTVAELTSGIASTPSSTATSSSTSPSATPTGLQFLGLSESCLEFGAPKYPGVYNVDYTSPNPVAMKNAASQFANLYRIPFAWERVQSVLGGELVAEYLSYIDGAVQTATTLGAVSVLDVHNYAAYNGSIIGDGTVTAADLADLWTRLANVYKNNTLVWFGLINEPHTIDATTWFSAAQTAIDAIRETGATNVITVPGNCWTGAHSWVQGNCDITATSNAVAALVINDPLDNIVFEMHQYFDVDFSGSHEACVNNYTTLLDATNWLRDNGKKGFLAEFAGASNDQCVTVVNDTLTFLTANKDVWVAASWWAGGPWWGNNMLSIESDGKTTAPDAVMIPILAQFKVGGPPPADNSTTSTPAATTTSLADLSVYSGSSSFDSTWQNWSWGTVFTFGYSSLLSPRGNDGLMAVSSNWGGISFFSPTTFNQYRTLAFFAAVDSSASYSLNFAVNMTGYSSSSASLSSICVGSLSSAAYVPCYVDLSALDPTTYAYDRITIQSASAGSQTILLADIRLSTRSIAEVTAQDQNLADLIIYSGGASLASSWQNWSWGSIFTFDFASLTTSSGHKAVQVVSSNWGGISFFLPTTFNEYTTFAFYAAVDPSFTYTVSLAVNATGYSSPATPLSSVCSGTFSSSAFVACYFDLMTVNPAAFEYDRITLQSLSANNQTIVLADLFLSTKTAEEIQTTPTTTTSTTGSSAATPTATISDFVIYDGGSSLESTWENWSWNSVFTFDFDDIAPPSGHGALQVVSSNWGGVSFYTTSTFSEYQTFMFYASGDPSISYSIGFEDVSASFSSESVSLSSACVGQIAATSYIPCYFDISTLNTSSYSFDRVTFGSISAGNQTVSLSDLHFSGETIAQLQSNPTTTTSTPTTTTTSTTTASPTSSSDLVVYNGGSDISSSWQNWSWGTVFTFDYVGISAPSGTGALQANSTNYGGISFYSSTSFNSYTTFAFLASGDPSVEYSVSFSVTSTSYSSASISFATACSQTLSSASYVECYVDLSSLSPTAYAFNRVTIQSNSADTQTIALADIRFSMLTAAELADKHIFTSGGAIGSNTLFLIGHGSISSVNVTRAGEIIQVVGYVALTIPTYCAYLTLASSWTAGSYIVSHADGVFSIVIPSTPTEMTLSTETIPINPLVYGYNLPASADYISTYGTTLARWGGNPLTTYNHPASSADAGGYMNIDNDWYFENSIYQDYLPSFVGRASSAGAKTFASLPALDWVAAQKVPCFSYNATKYGASVKSDPFNSIAGSGNGILANGSTIVNDPNDCYVPWDTTQLSSWLTGFLQNPSISDNIAFFSVDNEMDICSSTHVDIHPTAMTYDEELQRMLSVGSAIRSAVGSTSPIQIVGPTSCCFWFWWHSAAGQSDMDAHGGISKLRYLLRGWKAAESTTGKIFNGVDLHFSAIEGRSLNGSDSDNASRLRGTRNWWDKTYVDESYRGLAASWPASEPNPGIIAFIPRMKQLIADEYPGLALGASEWYSATDFVGGLEIADSLGIFGRYELNFATKWADADANTAGAAAFWLYTGGNDSVVSPFLSYSVNISVLYDPDLAGVYFASSTPVGSGKTIGGVFVNKDPSNYQSYFVRGWEPGYYVIRHFGNPAVGTQLSDRFTTTIYLDANATVVVPPYSALFLMPNDTTSVTASTFTTAGISSSSTSGSTATTPTAVPTSYFATTSTITTGVATAVTTLSSADVTSTTEAVSSSTTIATSQNSATSGGTFTTTAVSSTPSTTKVSSSSSEPSSTAACVGEWYQCGGVTYSGSTCCVYGNSCVYFNDYYSQCLPITVSSTKTSAATAAAVTTTGGVCVSLYGQCGGIGYSGPTCCTSSTCKYSNDYYSQCL